MKTQPQVTHKVGFKGAMIFLAIVTVLVVINPFAGAMFFFIGLLSNEF